MKPVQLAFLALAALWSCGPTVREDKARMSLKGSVYENDGTPVTGLEMKIQRSSSGSCGAFSNTFDVTKLDDKGEFSEAYDDTVATWLDDPKCYSLKVPPQPEGRSVATTFVIQDSEVIVPPLSLWKGELSKTELSSGDIQFSVKPAPSIPASMVEQDANMEATFRVKDVMLAPFRVEPSTLKFQVSPYVLEDFEIDVTLAKYATVISKKTSFNFVWEADRYRFRQKNLIPVSRQAACPEVSKEAPCVLTDGALSGSVLPLDENQKAQATLEFEKPFTARKVVLRGSSYDVKNVQLFGSDDDGETWKPLTFRLLADVPMAHLFELTEVTAINRLRFVWTQPYAPYVAEISVFE